MDPNTNNQYGQDGGMPTAQSVAGGQIPTYPNTSQFYDPTESTQRPRPEWQQAIYNNLVMQQQNGVPSGGDAFAAPLQPQQPVTATMQAYAAAADTANAPLGDITLTDTSSSMSGGGMKKGILIVFAVILALGTLVGIGFLAYNMGFNNGVASMQQEIAAETDDQPQEEEEPVIPELDFTLQTPEYKNERIEGEVGEQIIASDGFVLLVYNVTREYQPGGDEAASVQATGEYIKVDVLVGNADETKAKSVSPELFTLIDNNDNIIRPIASDDTTDVHELEPGMSTHLSVLFLLDDPSVEFALRREQGYRVSGVVRTTILQVGLSEGWGSTSTNTTPSTVRRSSDPNEPVSQSEE